MDVILKFIILKKMLVNNSFDEEFIESMVDGRMIVNDKVGYKEIN
jgi:hypothetical protein